MYKINYREYINILNWKVIYYGIKNDLIEAKSAIDYAVALIDNSKDAENSLAFKLLMMDDYRKEDILNIMSRFLKEEKSEEQESIRMLRLIILDKIKQSDKNISEKIDDIEAVYTEFNYPSELNSFIRYMPEIDDKWNAADHSEDENEKRIYARFCAFIEKERGKL